LEKKEAPMQRKIARTLLLLAIAVYSLPALAADSAGKQIAMKGNNHGAVACSSCHGKAGEGNPAAGYPYLAGLPVDYIKNQLNGLKNGTRTNAVMKPIASALSADEIDAVAKYYASLKNKKLSGKTKADSGQYPKGADLAHKGKWSAGVPSCFRCHGADGKGVGSHFPPIVGQPYGYLRNQLAAWKSAKRSNDPIGLMQSVAKGLDQDEIDAVAHYLAAQPAQ
jgi:cytochrome c553